MLAGGNASAGAGWRCGPAEEPRGPGLSERPLPGRPTGTSSCLETFPYAKQLVPFGSDEGVLGNDADLIAGLPFGDMPRAERGRGHTTFGDSTEQTAATLVHLGGRLRGERREARP